MTSTGRNLRWFNPREMNDTTIQQLATGRSSLVANFFHDVEGRIQHPAPGLHWLVTGSRGAGKSYFLRLVETHAPSLLRPDAARFVLLPEELPHVRAPHQLIDEIRRLRSRVPGAMGQPAAWRADDPAKAWATSLQALWAEVDEGLLIVGVENLKDLLDRAFADDLRASLLRTLLLHEPRIMLLATAVDGGLDQNYGQRLFRQFQHHPLTPWGERSHRAYLSARAAMQGRQASPPQLARIDAYSRFTGGNARVAALMADAILDRQDLVAASDDLNTILDWLSDYYRAQLKAMPENSMLLFDALVRGGEPASQTQVAERVQARQNDIARAFAWLHDAGHLVSQRHTGEKETLYRVTDRLFVQWYRMRYLEPGSRASLAVMADLIADTMGFADKWHLAMSLTEAGRHGDAAVPAELGLVEAGISWADLRQGGMSQSQMLRAAQRVYLADEPASASDGGLGQIVTLLERHAGTGTMAEALDQSYRLVCAKRPPGQAALPGAELAALIKESYLLSPVEKLRALDFLATPKCSAFQWGGLGKTMLDDIEIYEKLKPTEGQFIEGLGVVCRKAWADPIPYSWDRLTLMISHDGIYAKSFDSELDRDLVGLAASAVSVWQWRQRREVKVEPGFDSLLRRSEQLLLGQGQAESIEQCLAALAAAWPRRLRKAEVPLLVGLWSLRAFALGECDRNLDALEAARQAVTLSDGDGVPAGVEAVAHQRLGWALGATDQTDQAIAAHDHAVTLHLSAGNEPNAAWALGQGARLRVAQVGLADAVAHLARAGDLQPDARHVAWQQLADAIKDRLDCQGHAAAFALGCEILSAMFSQSDLDPARMLRLTAVDALATNLPLDLIDELIQQAPGLLRPGRSDQGFKDTQALLLAWTHELRLPADERALRRRRTETDQGLTWDALEKELPITTRWRLGISPRQTPSAQAQSLAQRMLACMR